MNAKLLRKSLIGVGVALAYASIMPAAAQQQDQAETPASLPATSLPAATQPAETPNPLPSAARLVQAFYEALEMDDVEAASICLDWSRVDPDVRIENGDQYVVYLKDILDRLEGEGHFVPVNLPDDPTAPTHTIGKDPLLLTLERQPQPDEDGAHRLWRFAAATVAALPELHSRLDDFSETAVAVGPFPEQPSPDPNDSAEVERLRSPYHLVEYFLVSISDTAQNTTSYADAMECLDFSLVDPEEVEQRGPDYADDLAAIFAELRASGEFDRETLEKNPAPEMETVTIGSGAFVIIIVRQSDARWRFSATTVQRIPEMMSELRALAEQKIKSGESPKTVVDSITPNRDTSSPRSTLHLFLSAMDEGDLAAAAGCLDMSTLGPNADPWLAANLAGKLQMVMNRHKVIVLQDVPNDPESAEPYTLLKHTAGRIEIDKRRAGERVGEWLFTAATVRDIERLYETFESKPILPEFADQRISFRKLPSLYVREYWAPANLKRSTGGLQMWQWLGLAIIVVSGLILRFLSTFILPLFGRWLLSTSGAAMLPRVLRKSLMPSATLAMLMTWWLGVHLLDLEASVLSWTDWTLKIVTVLFGVRAVYCLLDVMSGYFAARAAASHSRLDDVLVPLAHKTGKVLIVACGVLFVAAAFGFKIGPLLAGFGLGGLAFGLAAQDTLKNFFGSVNVVLDRPFQVGDWVKVDDVEGTVEAVGLRSSRLRTFYNSQITVPNSTIMNARVDNMGRRRYRRISCKISVTYNTPPEKLEAFCEGIRELIRTHPYTRKDYFHVYVNEFAGSAINILLYCFHETPEWGTELRERHRLFLDIVRLARNLGVEFAFPTQTVHLHHESSPPATPPAPMPGPPADETGAMAFGREQANKIVHEAFGDEVKPPPPVAY